MTHDEAMKLARYVQEIIWKAFSRDTFHDDVEKLCDHILSGDHKREIENAALYLPADKINDLQLASIRRLVKILKCAHHADIIVRLNGQDHHFEADWLKHLDSWSG